MTLRPGALLGPLGPTSERSCFPDSELNVSPYTLVSLRAGYTTRFVSFGLQDLNALLER